MGEKKRFKQNRGDFNNRYADGDPRANREEEDDLPPEYAILRSKHRQFERSRNFKERDERPARRQGERRDFQDGDRKFGGKRGGDRKFSKDRKFDRERKFDGGDFDGDRKFGGKRKFDGGRKPFPRREDRD